MASTKPLHLEITIISAKHLKNVNWRNGDLKPYATFYLDNSDHHLATHADDSLSTRPVWNERFTIPMIRPRFSPHPRRLPLQAIRNPQTSCRHREISTESDPRLGRVNIILCPLARAFTSLWPSTG
ncbi:hypothetical protein OIU76_020509 [Salix suchowensis]|nr:hypothetical protein OIU76_020509 [Salix suchowensis]